MQVGKEAVSAILSQVDIVFTLGVAVIGGIVALFIQIAFHNRDPNKKSLTFAWFTLIPIAFVLETVSTFFGYLTTAAVTDAIPILMQAKYTANMLLADHPISGLTRIRIVMTGQFLTFIAGIFCILAVFLRNLSLLKKE